MRTIVIALTIPLLISAPVLAQPPAGDGGAKLGPPGGAAGAALPTLNPANRLDSLLMQWEQRMKGVDSILVKDCVRTDKDKATVKTWKGEARYLKPNLAALRLVQQEDSKFYELMISTGNFLYEYRPQFKKRMIHQLPPAQNGNFDNNLLSFLFGMNAIDAKRRYELTLAKDIGPENPHYIYIDVKPRFEADKREFTRAQLVLFQATMLPRRLWFEHPNGSEVMWDLPNMDTTVKLKPSDFTPPEAPEGWENVRVPLADQRPPANETPGRPRIIRTGSDK